MSKEGAARMVHSIRLLKYSDRMRELGLPSLQYRRIRADLSDVFKILNGIDNYEKSQLFHTQPLQRTRGHSQKLFKRQFRLDLRRRFFSQRVIDDWNNLSENVISSDSINQFKSRLNYGKINQLNLSQTAIHKHLRMPDITNSRKEDKKGPKNREITLGLGYSKNAVSKSSKGSGGGGVRVLRLTNS